MKYEVNYGTLAVVPNNDNNSLVYEDSQRYIIQEIPFRIMEDSCMYFGNTYNGRRESSKSILGAEYKVPIVVEDTNNLILFPTTSPESSECVWISLNRIKSYNSIDRKHTKIIFDNGRELIVPITFRSFESQVNRATRLDYILRKRKQS